MSNNFWKNYIIIVFFTRGIVPFVLWWKPVFAIVASLILDTVDGLPVLFGWPKKTYDYCDKVFDLWWHAGCIIYASLFLPSNIFIFLTVLFIFRLIGHLIFFFRHDKKIFIFFPNFFEFFFIFFILTTQIESLKYLASPSLLPKILLFLALMKILDEMRHHLIGPRVNFFLLKVAKEKVPWIKIQNIREVVR